MSTSPSIEPSTLTWTGSVYGVAWQEYDSPYYDIYFLALDGTGAIVGSDIRVTTTSVSSQNPDAVWTGSEFGIVWHDASAGHQDIYLGRVGFCQ